ncbi:MAG: TonB-dependent receptor plug domain-containing protein [Myxococcales bacterium]|nr:TonB-dependent receptor plug domain-containing protein [Myxococcales bacterium]
MLLPTALAKPPATVESEANKTRSGPREDEIASLILQSTPQAASVDDVPAIVTVITADELVTLGYRTVADVLRNTPGFGYTYAYFVEHDNARTRGVPAAALIMINGTPINNLFQASTPIEYQLDLDVVNRIEIFASPGGVLWGANAWLGVVNIVTKDGQRNKGTKARVRLGSFGLQKYSVSHGGTYGPLSVYGHASLTLRRGGDLLIYQPTVVLNVVPQFDTQDRLTLNRSDSFASLSLRARAYDLELYGRLMVEVDRKTFTGQGQPLIDGRATRWSQPFQMVHLSYTPELTQSSSLLLKASYRYTPFSYAGRLGGGTPSRFVDEGVILGSYQTLDLIGEYRRNDTFSSKIFPNNQLTVGVEGLLVAASDTTLTAPATGTPTPIPYTDGANILIGSVYVFDELRIGSRIIVSAGARLNAASEQYYQPTILPKGALVAKLAEGLHLKVNYDEGMRPPFLSATRAATSFLRRLEDPSVEHSRVLSTQLVLRRAFGDRFVRSLSLSAGYSYIRLENVLGKVQVTGSSYQTQSIQLDEAYTIHSFQGTFRLRLKPRITLFGMFSHDRADETSLPFATLGPPTNFTLGAMWKPLTWMSLVVRNRMSIFDDRFIVYPVSIRAGTAGAGNDEIASFALPPAIELTAVVTLSWRYWRLQVGGYNLLDNRTEDLNASTIYRVQGASIPAQGRSFHASLQYAF